MQPKAGLNIGLVQYRYNNTHKKHIVKETKNKTKPHFASLIKRPGARLIA